MIRKLFFLLVLLCLNCSCSTAKLDAKSTTDTAVAPVVMEKENAALRRERHREMILAKIERSGINQ